MSEPMEDISKSNYQTGAQEVNNVETVTDYLFIYLFTEKKNVSWTFKFVQTLWFL